MIEQTQLAVVIEQECMLFSPNTTQRPDIPHIRPDNRHKEHIVVGRTCVSYSLLKWGKCTLVIILTITAIGEHTHHSSRD